MLHAGVPSRVVVTGQAALDAELPGGGWPLGGLVDLLQPEEGEAPLWPLLLPALAVRQRGGVVVLMGVPHWAETKPAETKPPSKATWVSNEADNGSGGQGEAIEEWDAKIGRPVA